MKFTEGLKISWQREWETGNPWRILQLAVGTVYYGALHLVFVLIPQLLQSWAEVLVKRINLISDEKLGRLPRAIIKVMLYALPYLLGVAIPNKLRTIRERRK